MLKTDKIQKILSYAFVFLRITNFINFCKKQKAHFTLSWYFFRF